MFCTGDDYDGLATILSSRLVKARKSHKCIECRGMIKPGEMYLNERITYEGTAETKKTCVGCISIRTVFFSCFSWGDILADLKDEYRDGNLPEDEVSILNDKAREILAEKGFEIENGGVR